MRSESPKNMIECVPTTAILRSMRARDDFNVSELEDDIEGVMRRPEGTPEIKPVIVDWNHSLDSVSQKPRQEPSSL